MNRRQNLKLFAGAAGAIAAGGLFGRSAAFAQTAPPPVPSYCRHWATPMRRSSPISTRRQ